MVEMTPPSFSVLIPDGESDFALFAMHGFIDFPQVEINVLSNQRWTPARFSRYRHRYLFEKFPASERCDAVAEVIRQHHIDVILPIEMEWLSPFDDKRLMLSNLAAMTPVLDAKTFEIANNKWLLLEQLRTHGIPTPPTILCTLDDDFEQRINQLQFPALVKPVTAWGGEGIHRFQDLAQLRQFLAQNTKQPIKNRYIVQSFLTGHVIGLNMLCRDGQMLAYTMQRGFIANPQQYAAAAAIEFIAHQDALELGKKLAAVLEYNGVANVDMFYDAQEEKIKILELNARFWGSLRGSYLAGVPFPYLACLTALNIPFPKPDYTLTRYIHPKTALKEGLRRLVGKGEYDFELRETGLKYMRADPVAETLRAWRQQLSSDRWQ